MNAMRIFENELTVQELILINKLNTPYQVQLFLDGIAYPDGDENRPPLGVLRQREGHCLDGGLFAVAILRRLGYPPLILDLLPEPGRDDDHVLALYRENGCWGAVAKSNYSGLRFREPIYRTLRELAISYFEDFFNIYAEKTLRRYSRPVDLSRFDHLNWMVDAKGVDLLEKHLKTLRGYSLITVEAAENLSPVDARAYRAGTLGINLKGAYKP